MSTVEKTMTEILAGRDAAHDKINTAYNQLDAQKRAIAAGAAGRNLTEAESTDIKTLIDGMATLARADAAIALDAVRALNSSADAKALAASLTKINADLTAKVEEIKGVSATITEIGTVTAKIDEVLKGVAALAPLLL